MSVEVTVTFPKGVSVNDVSTALVAAMKTQDYEVDGQLTHQEATINDQVVITDTWENEAKLNAFLYEFALPAFERADLPTPDIKIR
jgi:ornithine carbamoyltransferase